MEDQDIVNLYWCRDEAAIMETEKKYGVYCFNIAQNILKIRQDSEECIPDSKLVEHEIEEIELTKFLDLWLASLSKDDRILFMRRYWNGEALNVLEKDYKMSHGKMAKRMYQLRAKLKVALEKEGCYL